jgi:hypothetical protein
MHVHRGPALAGILLTLWLGHVSDLTTKIGDQDSDPHVW